MTTDTIIMLTGIATTVAIILGGWFAVVKFISPFRKRVSLWVQTWEKFMRDWAGTDAEPGRDAVPGVMQRLNKIDGELSHNGGKSIKDVVDRIDKRLVDGDKKFDDLYSRLDKLDKKAK
jgi:hypothetical protein|tara:strand:+ start:960 stop:1316 length:357 start_codon:yes stop_codon:yes gene_type:complete